MKTKKTIKVIISMVGLDGHTMGAEVVTRILMDAGIEVVYLGVNQSPDMICRAAIQEDVDAIGIISHASNHSQIEELLELLRENNMHNVPLIYAGNIPKHMAERLKSKGVTEIFPSGTSSAEIVSGFVKSGAVGDRNLVWPQHLRVP